MHKQQQQRQQRNSRQSSQVSLNRQLQQQQYQDNNYPPLAPPAPPPPASLNGVSQFNPSQNNNLQPSNISMVALQRPSEVVLQISHIPINPMNQEISLFKENNDTKNKQSKQKEKRKYPSEADGVLCPTMVSCPSCGSNVTTVIKEEIGKAAWVWCLIICMLVPLLSCFPLCMSSCKDKIHYCPRCKTTVGRWEKKICSING